MVSLTDDSIVLLMIADASYTLIYDVYMFMMQTSLMMIVT